MPFTSRAFRWMSRMPTSRGSGNAGSVRQSCRIGNVPKAAAEGFRSGVVLIFERFRFFAALQFVLNCLTDEQSKPAVADERLDAADRGGR